MKTFFLSLLVLTGFVQANVFGQEPKREKINLPGFEQGDLFLLRRMSNEKLVNVERSEWVHVAILIREGLKLSDRKEALAELAKLRKTDEVPQILDGITRAGKNKEGQTGATWDLIGLLMAAPAGELKKHRDALLRLATEGTIALSRQAGYASMMVADGAVDAAWRLGEKSEEGLVDLLGGAALISDPKVSGALYWKVAPLLDDASSRSIRQAAILAIASTSAGHEAETFAMLAMFVRQETERHTAIEALGRLPSDHWPTDQVSDLVESVLEYLRAVNPVERNTPEFQGARQLCEDLATVLPNDRGLVVGAALKSLGIQVVTIRTIPYAMRYDRFYMVVQAGQPIEITIENPDAMSHNLVIVMPGALQEVGIAGSQMLEGSKNWQGRAYVPDSDQILFATRMILGEQTETLTFVAPDAVGEYPFLCTYPGHWVPMNGILNVVEDVDLWIAENPVKATGVDPNARAFVQAWTMDDLVGELDKLASGRSLDEGKALFTAASCVVCHQVHKVGGAIGPELGEVTQRLKPAEMLAEILAPSKTINEKFRTWMIALDDGRVLNGIITKEDDEAIYVVQNPEESAEPIRISIDTIEEKKSSDVSTMPMGLLNTLTLEEILDLLAYIRSNGISSSGQ